MLHNVNHVMFICVTNRLMKLATKSLCVTQRYELYTIRPTAESFQDQSNQTLVY